ncbi:Helix-turn-helix domain-containing protein [Streptomyces zhaozhouensis]|uniref:Helix-turn-helix domain-containing protein n=1 Tax=Streptomyces zhaozhouensis TaxID=1300267 RepID=A0A286DNJ5_9ACTN|nr:helix-turn-helix domain-containing protein [Streptomyces zhaozhouensis]SOD60104.1 Helix-turn-helix domain-containing protein [Streptomyces zhaozhouensis]
MLRVHFTDADLARTRIAGTVSPLWEITGSLHRLQGRRGRWAYADWHHAARTRLRRQGLERALTGMLLPLFPRAAYLPDFLTPTQAEEGLDSGIEAILATPPERVSAEVALLERVVGAPEWAARLPELTVRLDLVAALRAYHEAAIVPFAERIQARIDAERSALARRLLDGGMDALLAGLGPTMRWEPPILCVDYPAEERDLHLNGRGLLLIPSYFCWHNPISLADSGLPPVLAYPLLHDRTMAPQARGTRTSRQQVSAKAQKTRKEPAGEALSALLGQTRATILLATAEGATNGELARAAGVAASSASRHATALRDAGLLTTSRHGASVLHTLTPLGAAMLRGGGFDDGFRPADPAPREERRARRRDPRSRTSPAVAPRLLS